MSAIKAPSPTGSEVKPRDITSLTRAWVQQIVIAQWGRTYAEALKGVCTQAFPKKEIVLCCTTGEAVLDTLRQRPTDVLLLALTFPDMDGLDLLRYIAQEKLATRVLVASHQSQEHSLQALRQSRFDGLIDTQDESADALIRALHLVAAGEPYISPTLRSQIITRTPTGILAQKLTPAEIHVLAEIGDGSNNQEAALRLGLTDSTVQTHRRNIMRKLGITSSAKLVLEAVRLGMVRVTTNGNIIRPGFHKFTAKVLS
jgi:two-component system, NarL family, nitrate/nitrite response regulator NarL